MLPARNFFQHQKPHFIARIEEVPRLRIVRGTHDVALQLLAQNIDITALAATGHRLANPGERLMPVQSPQLDDLAVEFESVVGELSVAESDAAMIQIDHLASPQQANMHGVEVRVGEIPELDAAQSFEVNRVGHGVCDRFGFGNGGSSLRHNGVAVAQLNFQRQRFVRGLQVLQENVHVQRRVRAEHVLGLGKNVFDENARNHAQRNLAVDAAEGEVINLVAKRRDVRALAGVDIHGQHVVAIRIEVGRKVKAEGRVAASIFAEARAIDPHRRSGHDAFKIDEHVLAGRFRRKLEAAAVERSKLVGLFVKAVPGEPHVGVRNHDALEVGIVEVAVVTARHNGLVEAPIAVDGEG